MMTTLTQSGPAFEMLCTTQPLLSTEEGAQEYTRIPQVCQEKRPADCPPLRQQLLADSLQQYAKKGDARGMYEGIKKATGPATVKTAPLKSKTGEVITDQEKQLQRWVDLYATQNVVTDTRPSTPSQTCLSWRS